ncbi:MAG: HAD-IA family hydrolase [Clostridiales Family XIII bacterium]|jgi:pyrophosphatase PpaX|nr:HAD-IA family hydrolase [Clostridiales Family XIII bacterium]
MGQNPQKDLTRVNTVLFDFDGTVMDTNELILESWRHTIRTLAGREADEDEIRLTLGEVIADSMRRLLPDVDVERAVGVYRDYQRDRYLDRIRLFDGTEETLRALKAAGCKTGLATSRLKNTTEQGLAHFGIADLFDAVLTASDTDKFKPDPAPLLMILEMLGSRPEEAVFIGDTRHDIEAGLAAGVFTVLVDWSFALPPEKRKDAPTPDAVIKDMPGILKLLGMRISKPSHA